MGTAQFPVLTTCSSPGVLWARHQLDRASVPQSCSPHLPDYCPGIYRVRCVYVKNRYLSNSRYATILVASSSVRPRFGISVPGFLAGGFMIQALRSSGPLLSTAPPAILLRLATPARLGPTVPLAPGMPGIVWQPTHGLPAMIIWPSAAGLPGSTTGAPPELVAAPS